MSPLRQASYLFLLLLTSKAHADTYWVDPSCPAREDFSHAIIEDAIEIAKVGLRRHNMRASDTNQALAFDLLFKVPQSNAIAFDIVTGALAWIAGLIEVTGDRYSEGHTTSRVRIQCDDDEYSVEKDTTERWQLVPNINDDPTPNSEAEIQEDQEYFDQYNWMKGDPENIGCKASEMDDETLITTVTYRSRLGIINGQRAAGTFRYNNRLMPSNIDPDRTATTLCDISLDSPYKTTKYFDWNNPAIRANFARQGLNWHIYQAIVSFTLLHELFHAYHDEIVDVIEGQYTWALNMGLTADEAIINAESFTHYALVALLRDNLIELADAPNAALAGDLQVVAAARTKRGWLSASARSLDMRSHARHLSGEGAGREMSRRPVEIGGLSPLDILPWNESILLQQEIISDLD